MPPKNKNKAPPHIQGKRPVFAGNEFDSYMAQLAGAFGPDQDKKPPESELLLLAMGIGPALCPDWDKIHFALPMEDAVIQNMAEEMKENGWKLPDFKISTQQPGSMQASYWDKTKKFYMDWLKHLKKTKKSNAVYTQSQIRLSWDRLQDYWSKCAKFFRNVWILNPHLDREDAYKEAKRMMKLYIKTKSNYNNFFTRLVSEIRGLEAEDQLDALYKDKEAIQDNKLINPTESIVKIQEILANLQLSTGGTTRQIFNRLKSWYLKIPMSNKTFLDRYAWLDELILEELPDEKQKRLKKEEKDRKAREKAAQKAAAEAAAATAEQARAEEEAARVNNEATRAAAVAAAAAAAAKADAAQALQELHAAASSRKRSRSSDGDAEDEDDPEVEDEEDNTEEQEESQAPAPAPAPASDEVAFLDLTIDDLGDFESDVKEAHQAFADNSQNLSSETTFAGPTVTLWSGGKPTKFKPPSQEWKRTRIWIFTNIQRLVNILTTDYGIELPKGVSAGAALLERAERCAVKLGFLEAVTCVTKAHVEKCVGTWIPTLMKQDFIPYMGALETILGPSSFTKGVKKQKQRQQYMKYAKLAIKTNFSSPAEQSCLETVVQAVIYKRDHDNAAIRQSR